MLMILIRRPAACPRDAVMLDDSRTSRTSRTMLKVIFFCCLSAVMAINAEATSMDTPSNTGNYALPSSQQPGPFYAFGQNMIDKNQLQLFGSFSYTKRPFQHYANELNSILYGVTDNLSLLVTFPVAVSYRFAAFKSSGYSDTDVQGEYAFYNQSTASYSDQATIVALGTIPTGSPNKSPNTGFGGASYFLGGTYNRTYNDWMYFASTGGIIQTKYDGFLIGNQYVYQAGLGRVIDSMTDQYIFFALLELDGEYESKNKIYGQVIPVSGGHFLNATPSIWFSTNKFIFQFGVSLPIYQHWNTTLNRVNYYAAASVAWTL